ncbi:MAG TPA: WcbI family polysaccharide biosynthesis putative acetyltransferase, partial [Stellaceae bacterium]|nr:WcbI family polysaccharide biosynthesis putative acetyltransferase [Stellaceae bacterium]
MGDRIDIQLAVPGVELGRDRAGAGGGDAGRPVLASLALEPISSRGSDGAVSVRRAEGAGCFLYGPFWRLAGGAYRLSFRCEVGRPRRARMAAAPVLGVEIIARNRDQRAWRDFTADELVAGAGSLDFGVPQQLSLEAAEDARFEFRFFHFGQADLWLHAVDLHHLDTGDDLSAAPRRWRLLGRLSRTAIGRRGPGISITVRRWAPASLLLHGGWPYLRLAEGRYRLSLSGRAAAPPIADQPLIAVEIIGRSRWRRTSLWPSRSWRAARRETERIAADDFTATELNGGTASLEFSVPLELSLDGGEAAPFEVRVLWLGSGGLTITGVDLDRLGEAEAPPAVMRWRLLGRMRLGRAATRSPEAVRVRRGDEPGTLLAGIRPGLRLGAGRYRLTVGAAAGRPRDIAQPVLGVRVTARLASTDREMPWRRPQTRLLVHRELQMADLAVGPVAVDFTIPAEAAGSDAARCEIALTHYGNADLTVTACDLLGLPAAETASTALSRAPARRGRIVIVGNCQAYFVHEAFRRAPALARRYTAKFHFVALPKPLHELGTRELRQCDLLLVQDIHDWQHYPLRDLVPDGIEIVKFPMLHFASLWPFDQYNGPGDREAYQREWPELTFLYLDGLLGRLRQEIPDPEARFHAYRSLDLPDVVNYIRLHDFERRRLLAMDRQFGGAIGEFILANFRERQLFYTINHPTLEILALLMDQL